MRSGSTSTPGRRWGGAFNLRNTRFIAPLDFRGGAGRSKVALLTELRTVVMRPHVAYDLHPCQPGQEPVALALSADEQHVAVVCNLGDLQIVDDAGRPVSGWMHTSIDGRESGVTALTWMPDGRHLVLGARSGRLVTLDRQARRSTASGVLPCGEILAIQPHPTRPLVAVRGERGAIVLWHTETGTALAQLPAHGITSLRFDREGTLWTFGAQVRQWRIPRQLSPRRFVGSDGAPGLSFARLSPDNRTLALGPGDGLLRVVDTANGREIARDAFQHRVLKSGYFFRDGKKFALATAGSPTLKVYDAATWTSPGPFSRGAARRIIPLASGHIVAGKYGHQLRSHGPPYTGRYEVVGPVRVSDSDVTHDRTTAWIVDVAGDVWRLDDTSPPKAQRALSGQGAGLIAVSGDGRVVGFEHAGQLVFHPVNSVTGALDTRRRTTLRHDTMRMFDLALSAAGKLVAAGLGDGSAVVWRRKDGVRLAVCRGHRQRVSGVQFSRDNQTVVTASWDGSARLWALAGLDRPADELAAEVQRAWGLTAREVLREAAP